MLRYLSSGESHGKGLMAIIEGIPANLNIDVHLINEELKRRQKGYGRGNRMKIEKDRVEILSGVRNGKTIGSPITLIIENSDYENWSSRMSVDGKEDPSDFVLQPRPGHGDLTGALKYNQRDVRNILERASARETAIRTAVGAVAKQFLQNFGIEVLGHVVGIGKVHAPKVKEDIFKFKSRIEESQVSCIDIETEKNMILAIEEAKKEGDSLGGIFEILIRNVPVGLGSHVQYDRKLDGLLSQGLMSLQAIKAVEIGDGMDASEKYGSEFQDEILYSEERGYYHLTNRAGGIEAGMSNGEDLILRGYMKPIPTLMSPLNTIHMETKEEKFALVERSDNCAVPAAAIVAEGISAFIIAKEMIEKFGGDSMEEMRRNYDGYIAYLRGR